MTWLLVILTCLTVYRLTRLLVSDKITEPIRNRIIYVAYKRAYPAPIVPAEWQSKREPMLAYFSTCPWCTSVWLGGLVVLVVWLCTGVPYPLLLWPATSAVTGFLSSKEGQ